MPKPKTRSLTIPNLSVEDHVAWTTAQRESGLDRETFSMRNLGSFCEFAEMTKEKNELIEHLGEVNAELISEVKRLKEIAARVNEKYDLLIQDLKDGVPVKKILGEVLNHD